jgi:hypothetical protein
MPTISVELLGRIASGQFQPTTVPTCVYFQADRIGLGRRPWMIPSLVLHLSTVSPRHALIERDGDSWVVRDLDSDNGLHEIESVAFSAGETPIRPQQRPCVHFSSGTTLSIGGVVLRVEVIPDQPL